VTTLSASDTLDRLIEAGFTFSLEFPHPSNELEVECEFEIDSWGSSSNGWDDPGDAAEFHLIDVTVTNKADELIHTKAEFSQAQCEWLEQHFNDAIQQKCAEYDGFNDHDD
jgi:hypothetical protein